MVSSFFCLTTPIWFLHIVQIGAWTTSDPFAVLLHTLNCCEVQGFQAIQNVTERRVIPGKSSLLSKAIKQVLLLPIRPVVFLYIIFVALFDTFLHVTCASSPVRGITRFQYAFIELVEKDLLPWGWMDPSDVKLDERRSVECDTICNVRDLGHLPVSSSEPSIYHTTNTTK
jgi:hypothetical protein